MTKMDIFWCVSAGLTAGYLACEWARDRYIQWRATQRGRRMEGHIPFPMHLPRGRQRHG